ncbi:peptidase S24 [Mangrovimonas yunxiaonensis]|uniref:Peptidase S24 n=1 Tax=Mangrovimonas yunxiaonensis TaxID=1197477 RepID=A0A084TL24_9FLAO|nr:translesion error-prone DNA polymerase V autoproteolytic subunit [Mangrovimonas yunxiaonensis]KFB01410.1 peptidase S24 [Mangrovimonas yunxiaonensis]MBR9758449.1 translesion error-prone DNA polymerase V autoproteolytic subunit [Algicola sp.]GGH36801.1 SOS-response transcriptional regulator UmuD-like protein [Mangrovimonas yunxiaonensis]
MLAKENSINLTFFLPDTSSSEGAVFFDSGISAGFPSPADDFKEERLSLDRELIKNKEATFFARVSGQSMIGAGLDDNDLLVIDRSLEPEDGKIAVCFLDGEFTVKRLSVTANGLWLLPENDRYSPIQITEENEFVIWGVVTNVIKKL